MNKRGPMMKNKNGSTLLIYLLLISSISLFYLKVIDYFQKVLLANRLKRQSTLCLKYTVTLQKKAVRDLNVFNIAIKAAHALLPLPKAAAAKKFTQIAQQMRFLGFHSNMTTNSYCNTLQKYSILKSFPYRGTPLAPKRSPDGTLQLKEKTWKLTVPSELSSKVFFANHILELNLSMKHKYALNVTREGGKISEIKDFPLLKHYYSRPSLPSLLSNVLK